MLALPRGGVPVGFEIARALAAPLDLVLVRKIGAPYQEELAIGAIADGEHPELVTDPGLIAGLDVTAEYLEQAKAAALQEIERRRRAWLGDRQPVDVAGRTAIVVDDGIATGATMRVALRATRRRKPARLVLAVPVAPPDTHRRTAAGSGRDHLPGDASGFLCGRPVLSPISAIAGRRGDSVARSGARALIAPTRT